MISLEAAVPLVKPRKQKQSGSWSKPITIVSARKQQDIKGYICMLHCLPLGTDSKSLCRQIERKNNITRYNIKPEMVLSWFKLSYTGVIEKVKAKGIMV